MNDPEEPDDDDLWEDIDELVSEKPRNTGKGEPVVRDERTKATIDAHAAQTADVVAAQRAAQVANLLIAGYSYEEIGASIGATAQEVEKMLTGDVARYIRTQPALRQWTRRWLSGKMTGLLEAVYDQAVDPTHRDQLAYHDRARATLKDLAKLHGAEAPTQVEVEMPNVTDAVQQVLDKVAASQGLAYDVDVFDLDPEDITEMTEHEAKALEAATQEVDDDQTGGAL